MKKIIVQVIICCFALAATAQNVSNVRFVQEGKQVKIYYDLSEEADVSIYLSTDGGKTYESTPIGHLSGHAGKTVQAGTGRCAVWDVLSDREKLQCSNIRFKVIARLDADKCFRKGYDYQYGRGVSVDYTEAVKWYRKAAEQGDADGQCNLGYMYNYGKGVPQDYTEAVKWYRKSAEQGNAVGQCNLGYMYAHGKGVPQDYTEAVKWYRKSAEQGNALGQCNLGIRYEYGKGVPQDYTEAVKWYRKAAEQGHARGQFNLGDMYEYGKGVTRDYSEAEKWYRKAAEQGDEDAKRALDRLGK